MKTIKVDSECTKRLDQYLTDNTDFSLVDGLIVHIDYVRDLSKGKVLAKIDRVIGHKNAPGNDTVITMIASEFGVSVQVPEDAKEEAIDNYDFDKD